MGERIKGPYDSEIQMFVQTSNVDLGHLRFLRWLAERSLLEHDVVGPATGPHAEEVTPVTESLAEGLLRSVTAASEDTNAT